MKSLLVALIPIMKTTITMADTDYIDELSADLAFIDQLNRELSGSDNSSEEDVPEFQFKTERMIPFYKNRKDILYIFYDDRLLRTFRFDRVYYV